MPLDTLQCNVPEGRLYRFWRSQSVDGHFNRTNQFESSYRFWDEALMQYDLGAGLQEE